MNGQRGTLHLSVEIVGAGRQPRVSAIIPTRHRPELVCRAVRSVLSQTFQDLECLVIVDGPDALTVAALVVIHDDRLKVCVLPENVGACEARNAGVRLAQGEWVALLDDDDEWLPQRLDTQLAAAARANQPITMVASRFLDRGTKCDLIRPRKFPKSGQHIAEFIWCEVSLLGGISGFPQTSTWLVQRSFLLEVPFAKGLKCLQDLDWLLRGFANPRMRAVFVDEPLAIFHNDLTRDRVTRQIDWRYSYSWAMENRRLFTRKAMAFFLVIYCVNPAAQQRVGWTQLQSLMRDGRNYGRLTPKLLWLYFLYMAI